MDSEFGSSSSGTASWTYDVFLSFRAKDTLKTFTGRLYNALGQNKIDAYIDLTIGEEEVSPAVLKAIEGSRISIIVFSANYAASKWCLDELVHILECRRSKNQMVRPIFYKVDPSDVRHQRGKFGEALAEHERRFKGDMDKVLRWRAALSEAANLSGWLFSESDGYESKFIDKIVEEMSAQVKELTYLDMPKYQVGLNSQVQDMLDILDVEGSDVRMVGIWGIGGIGKTTIAKAVYNTIAHKFECHCFLENVRGGSEQHGGLVNLQNILLSEILGGKELKVMHVDEGSTLLREKLRYKRILLVLDDVDQSDQLVRLAARPDWLHSGSRVIITTRDMRLLIDHQVNQIYEARRLNHDEAHELCSNVFKNKRNLDEDEKHLISTIVRYAQGLPFTLVVLCSHLCGRPIHEWQAILDGYKRNRPEHIQDILKVSYDDIACFFEGKNAKDVMQLLEGCDRINYKHSIEVPEEKALINVGGYGDIWMHDLLEEMGKDIVRQEPTEPGKRSRFWHHEDVHDILTENTIWKNLTSISLESCQFIKRFPDISGLPNLKNLNLNDCTSLVELDDSVGESDNLVDLSLSGCHNLIMFPRRITLKSVKHINFKGCRMLESLPEIVHEMECLTCLDLSGTAIKELPSSIGYLRSLEELVLKECENLTNLPSNIYELQHLWCLDLQNCSNLVVFPEWSSESLKINSKISHDLWYLNLSGCKRLKEIPELPPKVEWINVADCLRLKRFAKLSNILVHKESEMIKCITMFNCQRLCDSLAFEMAERGNILLNEVSLCSLFLSCKQSEFDIVFPGSEVPMWFSGRKDLMELYDKCEFSFEIPQNFNLENKGFAICAAAAAVEYINPEEKETMQQCSFTATIDIGADRIVTRSFHFEAKDIELAHVWLCYIPFVEFVSRQLPPFTCGVNLEHTSQGSMRCKSYGVHLVVPQDEDEDDDGDGDENDEEDGGKDQHEESVGKN